VIEVVAERTMLLAFKLAVRQIEQRYLEQGVEAVLCWPRDRALSNVLKTDIVAVV
jgi:hypothetical protein